VLHLSLITLDHHSKKILPGKPAMNAEDQNQRIQKLFLLQRVAQRINSILDLDVLLEEVVNDVAQTFGYSRSAVLLKDEATNELVIAAVRGWTINFAAVAVPRQPRCESNMNMIY
jgi:GAF domain-containing protein